MLPLRRAGRPARAGAGRTDAGPGLRGLLRGGGDGRRRARAAAGDAPPPASCPTSTAVPATLLERTALALSVHPRQSPGGDRRRGLSASARWPRAAARVRARGRRMLLRDLRPRAAARGAGGGAAPRAAILANVVVLHSLTKRSSAAGLRSGFVAGDPDVLAALPAPARLCGGRPAAAAARGRDRAVERRGACPANRELYRAKFDAAERGSAAGSASTAPQGGFFLWLEVGEGEAAACACGGRRGYGCCQAAI